jgi:hypothetical protein
MTVRTAEWTNRTGACEILGISNAALILLQRDKLLPPDCQACGRIRWRVVELHERREALRLHLQQKYGGVNVELVH